MARRCVPTLMALALVASGCRAACAQGCWIDLFNGVDLSGWTCEGASWTVAEGVLRNTGGYEQDLIKYNTVLPPDQFALEMRVRIVSGMRLRTHAAFDSIYMGNEGSIRQFEVYGRDITDVAQVGDDSYVLGQWYLLRLEVSATDRIELYKDNYLTHIATRTKRVPSQITIVPGDHYSPGQIEVSSIRYHIVPEPSGLLALVCGLGGLAGFAWWKTMSVATASTSRC